MNAFIIFQKRLTKNLIATHKPNWPSENLKENFFFFILILSTREEKRFAQITLHDYGTYNITYYAIC